MCESLAVLDRYVVKHPFYFESDHYCNWVDHDAVITANRVRQAPRGRRQRDPRRIGERLTSRLPEIAAGGGRPSVLAA